jgi:hypothetical protein
MDSPPAAGPAGSPSPPLAKAPLATPAAAIADKTAMWKCCGCATSKFDPVSANCTACQHARCPACRTWHPLQLL